MFLYITAVLVKKEDEEPLSITQILYKKYTEFGENMDGKQI